MRARTLHDSLFAAKLAEKRAGGMWFPAEKTGYGNQIFEIRNNEKRCPGKADTL
jgi:hypothetical protein